MKNEQESARREAQVEASRTKQLEAAAEREASLKQAIAKLSSELPPNGTAVQRELNVGGKGAAEESVDESVDMSKLSMDLEAEARARIAAESEAQTWQKAKLAALRVSETTVMGKRTLP